MNLALELADLLMLKAHGVKFSKKQRVFTQMQGVRSSIQKGPGMEFAEVRPYQPGDDIRHIDWRVTARTQSMHTKCFEPERDQVAKLLINCTGNMHFGSTFTLKSTVAMQAAACMAWSTLKHRDRLGTQCLHPLSSHNDHTARLTNHPEQPTHHASLPARAGEQQICKL